MSLESIVLPPAEGRPPADVRRFLREARRRVARYRRAWGGGGFVASDFEAVYEALCGLETMGLLTGRWFCEWGSGLGVVSCLAAMRGFESWGIEADGGLVEEARRLAEDFEVPVEFVHGSFIPDTEEGRVWDRQEFAWLHTGGPAGHEAIGLAPEDLDLTFAFPWPDEERPIAELFDAHARPGALLLTYHEADGPRLRRKAGPPVDT